MNGNKRLTKHTQELVDDVMVRFRRGDTYIEIGRRYNMSRNMIAGIVSRTKNKGETAQRSFRPKGWSLKPPPEPDQPLVSITTRPDGPDQTVIQPPGAPIPPSGPPDRKGGCQWIDDEPSADDKCKCGTRPGASKIYCEAHEKRAYRGYTQGG